MRTQPLDYRTDHRPFGAAATVVAHLAVAGCWWLSQMNVRTADEPAESIQWIDIPAAKKVLVKPTAPPPRIVVLAKPAARRMTVVTAAPAEPAREAPPETGAPAPPAAPAGTAARSAADIMRQARRDIGKIDKDLKNEFPERGIKAPPDSPQIRLEKGIELANELAPPKWYEKAKIKEMIDPGGYGRRRYRIVTAWGVKCWTYDSPRAPNGGDPFNPKREPKVTNCPEHEEPAKAQKW